MYRILVSNMEIKIYNTDKVEKYMKKNNLSKKQFCKLCNICVNSFEKFMKLDLTLNVKILFKIADYMNINLRELFSLTYLQCLTLLK